MQHIIRHTKPFFDNREVKALEALILSGSVNEGDIALKLVNTVTAMVNAVGGVATSTGTLGLHLCLKALGIESSDDEVIIPDFSCRSLFDCVRMAGGTPVFCDINLDDYSLDINSVRKALSSNSKAIILPHMYGCPADIDDFLDLGILLIEDCAHSLGATYKGRPVGCFGIFSVFSFEGSKLISAGEGGIVLTNDNCMLDYIRMLRYGLNGHFAYHYRLSDLVSTVALAQLEKLPFMIERRRYIAQFYRDSLEQLEKEGFFKLPQIFPDKESVYYRFVVLCDSESARFITFANEKGVLIRNPLRSGCLSDGFGKFGRENRNARILARNGISLPIYPDLTDDEMRRVVKVIAEFYGRKV